MLESFLLLKLNRGIWVALLNEEKIIEGIRYFEDYRDNLVLASRNLKLKSEAHKELTKSKIIFIQILNKLASKYYDAENYSDALKCYTALFKYEQHNIENIKKYIECLKKAEQYDLVIDLVKYLEILQPDNIEIYKLLSEMYGNENNNAKAVFYIQKYIDIKGEANCNAQDYNLLGCMYDKLYSQDTHNINDGEKSLEAFYKANELDENNYRYLSNIIIMLTKLNENNLAKKYWDILIKNHKLNNSDKFNYAYFCLKTKDFKNWHKYFDTRFVREYNPTPFPKLKKEKWNGKKDISNSTVLIHSEQGFGDTFLMWGYIDRIVKLAKKVIVVVQDETYELFKHTNPDIEVISKNRFKEADIEYDYYIPFMSLPTVLKVDIANISVGENYIEVRQTLIDEYKEKYFNNKKLKIGLSISGSKSGNQTRDIPLNTIAKLDKLKDVEFYILTKDIQDKDLTIFKKNRITNLAKEFKNFEHTAAAIKNMDLVITTDNCIMNLAGGLGIKTFALFNWHYEPRWFDLSGENIVWLTSVKPFVNDKMDNWDYSINNIIQSINKILQ
ncbi:hypothetical protein J6A64_06865 [bacterium]|nr:hypothetical protein [bacterium]